MPRLETFDGEDLRALGETMRGVSRGASSMEEAAAHVVGHLYEQLEQEDGAPATALVRLYKTHPYGQLPADLQEFAHNALDREPADEVRCLTMLASRGLLPEWNDPKRSVGHRAIPLPSPEFVKRLPMVAALVDQLGLGVEDVVSPAAARIVELSQRTYGVFHVPEAVGSPYLPAQDDFVVPHRIRSAVGFGGVLFTGDFFSIVVFSLVPVPAEVADRLRVLSLAVRVPLLQFVNRVFT